ncbi:MAG: formylglycine-generating enzyme family protein [Syntrophobacteraceae bacterium]
MPWSNGFRLLAILVVTAFLVAGTPEVPEGASSQKDQPSVDRLNVEDFERKPESPKPKPKPRTQPRAPASAPVPADGKQDVQPTPVETKPDQPSAKTAASGSTWREPLTGLEFVWLPDGCFEMGSPSGEKGRKSDESLPHRVCVEGLWVGKTEVTVGAFLRFVDASGYKTEAEREGFSWYLTRGKQWTKRDGANWKNVGFDQRDSHPVVNVSWNDAKAMADWLSRQGKGTFRLPKETEWEYGCRAGTKAARFWGESPDDACRYANVSDWTMKKAYEDPLIHECDDRFIHGSPAATFQPNGFGLYDMLGNAGEWCEDASGTVDSRQKVNPNRLVNSGQADRVFRGGSWRNEPDKVRCAERTTSDPVFRRPGLGFRLVRLGNPPQ